MVLIDFRNQDVLVKGGGGVNLTFLKLGTLWDFASTAAGRPYSRHDAREARGKVRGFGKRSVLRDDSPPRYSK